jgi:O-acetylhomoserine/O-acetylserine sulfhydrylase-like pyridoxal-dependent enzyme
MHCLCVHMAQVTQVHYPGLPSHPRAQLVQQVFSGRGAGGMLAFEVASGAAADAVLQVRACTDVRRVHVLPWACTVSGACIAYASFADAATPP